MQAYDIAVIGGGPAGSGGALQAARLGARVVLFEAENVGGTCLNVGCVPTKCYVAQAELLERIRQATEKGIFREAGLFSFQKIHAEKDRVVRKLTGGVHALLKAAGVDVISAMASPVDAHRIQADGKTFSTKKLLLATGSKNAVPPIPGIDGANVLDSTGLLALQKAPKRLAVVGAGVIGLEFASAFASFGSAVTAIDVLPGLLPGEDQEAVSALQRTLTNKGVQFALGSKVVEIGDRAGEKYVTLECQGKRETLTCDCVLVGVGRTPVNEVAKQLGAELDARGFVKVDAHMRTSLPDVYAAGDLTGGYLLAHSAYQEAEAAVRNCLGEDVSVDLNNMPRCIFTLPGYAAVGLTAEQATGQYEVATGKFPFAASGKAMANGCEEGFIKWVAEKSSGRLLGCAILGVEAAELLSAAIVALNSGLRVEQFAHMIFPHPTLIEGVKEAALDCAGGALHIPSRAKS